MRAPLRGAHLSANQSYYDEGVRILELANKAYSLYLKQDHYERAKLLKIVLSYCSLKDGTLCPTYKEPFDMLAKGVSNENWRPQWDSNPCYPLALYAVHEIHSELAILTYMKRSIGRTHCS